MTRLAKKPAELRDSWRAPDKAAGRARPIRFARRAAITLLAAGLLVALYIALFGPFWHPNTHLVWASAGNYGGLETPPIEFAAEDGAALREPLAAVLYRGGDGNHGLSTPDDFAKLTERLAADDVRGDDVVVLYLQAHGVAIDGEPFLLCGNFTATAPRDGRYALKSLLQLVRQSTAAVKLLVLDAGRYTHDPRLGMIADEFPRLLRQEVEAVGDPGLWVLSANSPLERSHLMPARRQSAFGHFVARGLQGEADFNTDRLIDAGELFRFVRTNVAHWVTNYTAGHERQTPMLLRGTGLSAGEAVEFPVLLSVSALTPAANNAAPVSTAPPEAQPASTPEAPTPNATSTAPPPGASATMPTPSSTQPPPANVPTLAPAPVPASLLTPVASLEPAERRPQPAPMPTVEMSAEQLVELGDKIRAAAADRSIGTPIPIDYAPAWWRLSAAQFASLEHEALDASVDRRKLEVLLRRTVGSLAEFTNRVPLTADDETFARLFALRRPPLPDEFEPRTWALVERAEREAGPTPPADLKAHVAALDEAFADDDRQALDALFAKPLPPDADRYDELRFARQLAAPGLAPWPTLQLAWRACREGERATVELAFPTPELARVLESAHRARAAGRRALFDQIGGAWNDRAVDELSTAVIQYRAVLSSAVEWQRAVRLRNDCLYRAPAYVRWHYLGAGDATCAPRYEELIRFLDSLEKFCGLLERPESTDAGDLIRRREQLESLVELIEAPASKSAIDGLTRPDAPPTVRRRIGVLLAAAPLSPERRAQLQLAAGRIDAETPPPPAVPLPQATIEFTRAVTPQEWLLPLEQRELAVKLARLAELRMRWDIDESGTETELRQHIAVTEEPALWDELRDAGLQVAAAYDDLPTHAAGTLQTAANLADIDRRATHLMQLRAVERAVRSCDARDVARLPAADAGQLLRQADWHEAALRIRRRMLLECDDASPDDLAYYTAAADDCRELAAAIPNQPPLPAAPAVPWKLAGPTDLSTADQSQRELLIALEYQGTGIGRTWVVVEYDRELFDIKMPPPAGVYEQSAVAAEIARRAADAAAAGQLLLSLPAEQRDAAEIAAASARADRAEQAGEFPISPDRVDLPPTAQLNAGERREFRFTLRRLGTSAQSSKVVVRAISGETHLRHETLVRVPSLETISFAPVGAGDSWSRTVDGVVLHPLPNRTTDYEFQVANLGTIDKVVDIEFTAPERRVETTLPSSLRTLAISEVLSLVGPSQTLMKIDKLTLPAGGKPLTLAAPKPREMGDPPPTDDEKNKQESNVGTTAKPGEEPPPIPVRQGMLMILRERDTGNTLLRRIDFRPQRPRRYVQADVGYNAALERIELRVTPRDRSSLPAGGCKVACRFPEPLARGTEAQLAGTITAPDFSALLYIAAPLSESRVQTVYLDVDDYPRAFIYEVPCGAASTRLPEVADALDVRITAPPANTMFRAPTESIPAELEVDAPVGAFDGDRDLLEVGIDRDRDRDFHDESTLRLHSDRQAEVFLKAFGTNGIATFQTKVGDFMLAVPSGALQNVRANLAARVQVGPRTAWSRTVEIGLDGAPPQIGRVELTPGRTVAIGTELKVDVAAVDVELSGVGLVEVGFDLAGQGKFNEASPPVPATAVAQGMWTAKLPTKPLPPGNVTLLVRATDKAGNVGEFTKVPVAVVSAADAEAAMKAAGSRVSGTVRYGGEPLEKARVAVVSADMKEVAFAETDAKGFFAVEGIPAGTYTLAARGLARNRPRTAEVPLVVPPPPAKVPRQDLEVK